MKNKNRILAVFLLLLAVLLTAFNFAFTAAAQDVTPEVVPATLEPTAVSPVNVNINTAPQRDEATTPLPEGNISIPGWSVLVAIVLGIGAGYSLPRLIDSIRGNPAAIAELEAHVDTLPEPVTTAAHKAAEVLESAARLLNEATDRVAAASKPAETANLKLVDFITFSEEARQRGYALTPLPASVQNSNPYSKATNLPIRGAPGDSEDR